MAKSSWFRPSVKRARTWCVVAAVVVCVMIAASSRWTFSASYGRAATAGVGGRLLAVRLDNGALAFYGESGWQPSDHTEPAGFNVEVARRWDDDVTLAWRPYHVAASRGFSSAQKHHGFVFPLWLFALPAVVGAAYLQGVVSGLKRADKGRCVACGYNRAGLAAGAPCPECGKA